MRLCSSTPACDATTVLQQMQHSTPSTWGVLLCTVATSAAGRGAWQINMPHPHMLCAHQQALTSALAVQVPAGTQTSRGLSTAQGGDFTREPRQPTAELTAVQTTPSAAIVRQQISMDLVSTSASTASVPESLADHAIADVLQPDLTAPASDLQASFAQTMPLERQQPQQAAVQAARRAPARVSSAVQTGGHVPSPGDAAHQQRGIGAREQAIRAADQVRNHPRDWAAAPLHESALANGTAHMGRLCLYWSCIQTLMSIRSYRSYRTSHNVLTIAHDTSSWQVCIVVESNPTPPQ